MDFAKLLDKASRNAQKAEKAKDRIETELSKEERRRIRDELLQRKEREIAKLQAREKIEASRVVVQPKFQIPKVRRDEPQVDVKKVQAYLQNQKLQKDAKSGVKAPNRTDLPKSKNDSRPERPHITSAKPSSVSDPKKRMSLPSSSNFHASSKPSQLPDSIKKTHNNGSLSKPSGTSSSSRSGALPTSKPAHSQSHAKSSAASKPALATKRPAPPVDFHTLMKAAEAKARGERIPNLERVLAPPPEKRPHVDVSSKNFSMSQNTSGKFSNGKLPDKSRVAHLPKPAISTGPSSTSFHSSKSSKMSLPPSRKEPNPPPKKDAFRMNPRNPSPPRGPPPSSNGQKRFLPGDMRYNPAMGAARGPQGVSKSLSSTPSVQRPSSSSLQRPTSSSSHSKQRPPTLSSRDAKADYTAKRKSSETNGYSNRSREPSREEVRRREKERLMKIRKAERDRRYESMSLIERERERERRQQMRFIRGGSSDEEEEGEDEYVDDEDDGSDLDDFIDDSAVDDLCREDFEEVLQQVNKNYDVKKWKRNEAMIDERQMHASASQLLAEEAQSARLGLIEDLREARRGSSRLL